MNTPDDQPLSGSADTSETEEQESGLFAAICRFLPPSMSRERRPGVLAAALFREAIQRTHDHAIRWALTSDGEDSDADGLLRTILSTGRNRGSAKKLVGDVTYATLVAHEGRLQISQIDQMEARMRDAFRFFHQEAIRWDVDVTFTPLAPPIYVQRSALALGPESSLGKKDVREIEKRTAHLPVWKALAAHPNSIVLVFHEGSFRASAFSAKVGKPRRKEFCLCPLDCSAFAIAHEVTHLFGGIDLYEERIGSERELERINSIRRKMLELLRRHLDENELERDLMIRSGPLSACRISKATAYAVGWCDSPV